MQWNAKLWGQSIHRFKAFMTPLAAIWKLKKVLG